MKLKNTWLNASRHPSSWFEIGLFIIIIIIITIIIIGQSFLVVSASAAKAPVLAAVSQRNALLDKTNSFSAQLEVSALITYTLYIPFVLKSPEPTPTPDDGACNPSNGSGGLAAGTITETTVGGLLSSVVVGDGYNPDEPTYLVFYLHGDEGNYSQFQIKGHKVAKLVNEKGWILVAPRAHLSDDGKYSWWKSPEQNIPALDMVFTEMFANYNLCRNTILGGTLSGGSTFFGRFFFPEKGGTYPAHIILFCGGVKPNSEGRAKVAALGKISDITDRSSFKFNYGTEDFLYPDIQETIGVYTKAGFTVSEEVEAGVGHCVSNTSQKLRDFLEAKATELNLN